MEWMILWNMRLKVEEAGIRLEDSEEYDRFTWSLG